MCAYSKKDYFLTVKEADSTFYLKFDYELFAPDNAYSFIHSFIHVTPSLNKLFLKSSA